MSFRARTCRASRAVQRLEARGNQAAMLVGGIGWAGPVEESLQSLMLVHAHRHRLHH